MLDCNKNKEKETKIKDNFCKENSYKEKNSFLKGENSEGIFSIDSFLSEKENLSKICDNIEENNPEKKFLLENLIINSYNFSLLNTIEVNHQKEKFSEILIKEILEEIIQKITFFPASYSNQIKNPNENSISKNSYFYIKGSKKIKKFENLQIQNQRNSINFNININIKGSENKEKEKIKKFLIKDEMNLDDLFSKVNKDIKIPLDLLENLKIKMNKKGIFNVRGLRLYKNRIGNWSFLVKEFKSFLQIRTISYYFEEVLEEIVIDN